jgi:hypothetical protein
MSRDGNAWTCDEPGCTARVVFQPDEMMIARFQAHGWYQVGAGFMNHRCPEHAPPWQAYDIAERAYGKAQAVEWDRARDAFELAWNEAYEAKHPAPKMPGRLR